METTIRNKSKLHFDTGNETVTRSLENWIGLLWRQLEEETELGEAGRMEDKDLFVESTKLRIPVNSSYRSGKVRSLS